MRGRFAKAGSECQDQAIGPPADTDATRQARAAAGEENCLLSTRGSLFQKVSEESTAGLCSGPQHGTDVRHHCFVCSPRPYQRPGVGTRRLATRTEFLSDSQFVAMKSQQKAAA